MRFCSWCHFRLKEVKESLHRVLHKNSLQRPLFSKLHKRHCRKQELVWAATSCINSDISGSLYSTPWHVCFFFVLFFLCCPFNCSMFPFRFNLDSDRNTNKRLLAQGARYAKRYNKISFQYFLQVNKGLFLLVWMHTFIWRIMEHLWGETGSHSEP